MGRPIYIQSLANRGKTDVFVKKVETAEELDAVYKLVHDTFVDRGIIQAQEDGRLINNRERDVSPNTTIFIACQGNEVVGTISFTLAQNPEEIYNYSLFSDAIQSKIRMGEQFFSGWRFATNAEFSLKPIVVCKLMLAIHKLSFKLNVRNSFFSFVAEHIDFYRKLFPSGEILDRKNKSTSKVNADLFLMQYWTDFAVFDEFKRRIDILERRRNSTIEAKAA